MAKYRLTCKKCNLDQTHDAYSMDAANDFWNNWNHEHGEDMKCVHEYEFEELK